MNLIKNKIETLKKKKKVGLMTHVVIGYPTIKKTVEIVLAMEKAGADFVELQIPFSDPLADGPTIMKACEVSLKQKTKIADAFRVAKVLTKKVKIPIIFMSYYNNVFKYGVQKFCRDSRRAGISGLIVPDLPIEEREYKDFRLYAKENGLYVIQVLSPVSDKNRALKNSRIAEGFVYYSLRQGVTGVRKDISASSLKHLKEIRKLINVPIAGGFGISKPEQLERVSKYTDMVVVGSAVINIIEGSNGQNIVENVERFVGSLKKKLS